MDEEIIEDEEILEKYRERLLEMDYKEDEIDKLIEEGLTEKLYRELINEMTGLWQEILIEVGYTEKQVEKFTKKGLTKEKYEELISAKETETEKKFGQVWYKHVDHSSRAEQFGRMSDGEVSKYVNIALEYFGHRCALSGEKFISFGKDKVSNSLAKSNLSADHVVPLCAGGHDIIPNIVPAVLQYNEHKNGYNLLDWLPKQKDNNGKSLYSPYRLLKIVNFMLKSLEVRGADLREYKKAIMTNNAIDNFLNIQEEQDEKETDNSKRKIISDTETTVTEKDGKKILAQVPTIEGSIPKQSEEKEQEYDDINMTNIFLADALQMIKDDKEIGTVKIKNENGQEVLLVDVLDKIFKKVRGTIPFEVEVRNLILTKLEESGVEENKYTVADILLKNIGILEYAKENGLKYQNEENLEKTEKKKEALQEYVNNYFKNKEEQLIYELELSKEQIEIAMAHIPEILYDKQVIEKIWFYKENRPDHLNEYLKGENFGVDDFIDEIIILQQIGVDTAELQQRDNIESLAEKSGITIDKITERGLNPYENIGKRLSSISQADNGKGAHRPPTEEQKKELLNLGISLHKEEIDDEKRCEECINVIKKLQLMKINMLNMEKNDTVESLAAKSNVTTDQLEKEGLDPTYKLYDTIQEIRRGFKRNEKLEQLQNLGIDISNIKRRDTIEKLAINSGITIDQLEKEGLNPTFQIGRKGILVTETQMQELMDLGIDIKAEKNAGKMKKIHKTNKFIETKNEFMNILEKLESLGVDTSYIEKKDKIITLAIRSGVDLEKIKESGLNPQYEIGKVFNNIRQICEKIAEKEISTSEEQSVRIINNIRYTGRSSVKRVIGTIKILQRIGVDISNIQERDKIKTLADNSGIAITRIIDVGLDPAYTIGASLHNMRQKNEELTEEEQEELLNLGIEIELEKRNPVQEFIDNIEDMLLLKIDVSEIKDRDTIETLAIKSKVDLKKVKSGLDPEYKVGNALSRIRQAYRVEQKRMQLEKMGVDTSKKTYEDTIGSLAKKSGITEEQLKQKGLKPKERISANNPPTKEQVEKILSFGLTLEKEEIYTTDKFISDMNVLQKLGVNISKLTTHGMTIKSLAEKSGITKEQLENAGLNPKQNIGIKWKNIRQAYKKTSSNNSPTKEQVEELLKLGLILEGKNKAQDIGKASFDASTQGCDEKQEFMEDLERKVIEKEEGNNELGE